MDLVQYLLIFLPGMVFLPMVTAFHWNFMTTPRLGQAYRSSAEKQRTSGSAARVRPQPARPRVRSPLHRADAPCLIGREDWRLPDDLEAERLKRG